MIIILKLSNLIKNLIILQPEISRERNEKMAKIELLYPEIWNLFGNMYNIQYLQKCTDQIKVVETALTDKPKFLTENIDMVYMAPMTEKSQELVIEKIKPYWEEIKEQIKQNKIFFTIGNALEIFGQYIENEDGTKIEGLGITNLYAKRDMMHRYNSLFLGKFEDMKIVGFKSQFSMSYGDNSNEYLFKAERGDGINKETKFEGIHINNFIGTYILGPILILNPQFCKYILNLLNIKVDKLAFDEEITNCYNIRLKEFENPKTIYD